MSKIKIKHIKHNDIRNHNDYATAIQWVQMANENKSENNKRFEDIEQQFPSIQLFRPNDTKVFQLEKHWMGMIFVNVTIEGQIYKFLLDTGAQVSCISSALSQQLKEISFSEDSIEVGDAGGYLSKMQMCSVKAFEFYDVKIKDLPMLILRDDQLVFKMMNQTLYQLHGILGWDILRHLDFEIDYNGKMVMLIAADEKMSYNFLPSEFPLVLVEGQQGLLKMGIDLGAKKSWIHENTIEQEHLEVTQIKSKKSFGVNGVMVKPVKCVKNFTVKWVDYELAFKSIQTGFTGYINDYELDGVFGIDIMKKHKIRILNSKGRVELIKHQNKLQ